MPLTKFAIVSPGRTGSTLFSTLLSKDPRLLGFNELIEPIEDNPFFSSDLPCSSPEQFFLILNQTRPKYIVDLWERSLNKEVLFNPIQDSPTTFLCYTLPSLCSFSSPLVLKKALFDLFCQYLLSNQVHSSTPSAYFNAFTSFLLRFFNKSIIFERTGGGSREIFNLYTHFEKNIVVNLRAPSKILESFSKHIVFTTYARQLDYRFGRTFHQHNSFLHLLIYLLRPISDFASEYSQTFYLLNYESLCSSPKSTISSFYRKFLDLAPPSNLNFIINDVKMTSVSSSFLTRADKNLVDELLSLYANIETNALKLLAK